MKLLFTGKGGSGSWQVRAEQLGSALGAKVKPFANGSDFFDCDLAVVVKRTPEEIVEPLRKSGKPWVFDIVDCYPQPLASDWTRDQAIGWVRKKLEYLKPNGVVWPTQRMRSDCDIGLPGIVLPHHHRPNIKVNPIREKIQWVGYEGRAEYLAEWLPILQEECSKRGWRFTTKPAHLADLDVVVALRGGHWNGYVQRHWKSNVKLANAHGSGTPFMGQLEDGYTETAAGCEYWIADRTHIGISFNWLESQTTREQIADRFLDAAYPIEKAANALHLFLQDVA